MNRFESATFVDYDNDRYQVTEAGIFAGHRHFRIQADLKTINIYGDDIPRLIALLQSAHAYHVAPKRPEAEGGAE